MPFTVSQIKEARERIAPYITETPLIRLGNLDQYLGCRVYAKLESMQRTGSFKLRGAVNKLLSLSAEQIGRGVVAASSGNHGKALAYAAGLLGAKCTVVMPRTAPRNKIEAIGKLVAEVVLCETSERFRIAEDICRERGGTMAPPYDDYEIMAGQGTAGLEILEQEPDLDCVISPVSGGGLIGGLSTALKAVSEGKIRVVGAEPDILPRYSESLAAGERVTVPQRRSLADALASQTPGARNFPVVQANVDGVARVSEEYIKKGMKLLLTEGKLLAEPASCIGAGALLEGLISVREDEKVCLLISGGNVGLEQLEILRDVSI
ncbi:MAG: threonine/serine dehydratase [Synergistaceae bacterium]|nr:threonine/serine dehydratase [Synergistaceae bacterium]